MAEEHKLLELFNLLLLKT